MKLTLTQNLKRSYCKDYQNKWYIKIHIIWIIFKNKNKKNNPSDGLAGAIYDCGTAAHDYLIFNNKFEQSEKRRGKKKKE